MRVHAVILFLCCILMPAHTRTAGAEAPLPPYDFSPEDGALLDDISKGAFLYFLEEAHPVTGLMPDKLSAREVCSIAAQGFGFAALPVGVERGWVEFEEAEELALRGLRTLRDSPAQRWGFFAHYLDMETGSYSLLGYEQGVSSIDTALMIAGALVAGQYFGGEVKEIADELYSNINWAAFRNPDRNNQVYMVWTPDDLDNYGGSGSFGSPVWGWYSDETLLINLLGIGAPTTDHRLHPYHAMRNWNRPVGRYRDGEPFVYTWPGTLFTYTFAQCFYDFSRYGPGPTGENWFLNTRAAVRANRDWCRDNADTYATYGQNRWGITASSGPTGYEVPGHQPRGASGNNPMGGTLATYGAGMAVLWEPEDAMTALRHMRTFTVRGKPLWSSPAAGGYGFRDAFNVDADWVANNVYGIAHGPMLLCIENARSGLVHDLFHSHPWIQEGMERAGFELLQEPAPELTDILLVH